MGAPWRMTTAMQLSSTSFARRYPIARRRRPWKPLLALLAIGSLYLLMAGDDGMLRLRQRRQEQRELASQVVRLEVENDSLRQVLTRLEHDLEYVEKVAREEYGMTKKGEQLYRLRPSAAEGEAH